MPHALPEWSLHQSISWGVSRNADSALAILAQTPNGLRMPLRVQVTCYDSCVMRTGPVLSTLQNGMLCILDLVSIQPNRCRDQEAGRSMRMRGATGTKNR